MKRILGLDLGSSSIGWAIIDEYSTEVISETQVSQKDKIVALGSRIIPLSTNESTQFSKGQALTKNADRTKRRTQRKGYDRYQLRRALLLDELTRLGMYNGTTMKLPTLELWGLRAKATSEKISLLELGRILLHINQKRGYRTIKSDYGDKKLGEYVNNIVGNHRELHKLNLTIGQFLYNHLLEDSAFRCKGLIFPRNAYIEEFDKIITCQKSHYPEILTDEVIDKFRNYIIFHQRPLKSCKHLVGRCELERCDVKVGEDTRNQGPKVAPRSSPLFQVCKIWEKINNLKIENSNKDIFYISLEQKQAIFNYLNCNKELKATKLKDILGIKSKEWLVGKAVGNGLQGNTTYCAIANALQECIHKDSILKFNLTYVPGKVADEETGELTKEINPDFTKEPLYKLWHALYSISNIEELRSVLRRAPFNIEDNSIINALCQIDFVKAGYSNISTRAIRKILPYLQDGIQYHYAKEAAGYRNTSLTKEQNEARELAKKLLPIKKGALRQPIVEKILNQLVNLVNALMSEYGKFDEIRVELARELKQSKDERKETTNSINRNQRENETIAKRITSEYGLTATRRRIQKYKMWEESENKCLYCGSIVNASDFLNGSDVEIEHIIPRSVLFDDSFSNKVCACHVCNQNKDNLTGYDFMKNHPTEEFNAYITRVNDLYTRKKISKTKRDKLLMSAKDLPSDFIERQLRETQYIAKKAKEMLLSICHNVYSTTGSITDFIRHHWGWDEILHSLNFERYKSVGLTEMVTREIDGKKIEVERIKEWSKRMDHRHHAIDALTIACTKQGYIQRINNLNSLKELPMQSFTNDKQDENTHQRLISLKRYLKMQPHFSTAEVAQAVDAIAVSFKGGKRAASTGKRYIRKNGKRICVQKGIIIPRGALSNGSIYGQVYNNKTGKKAYVIKYKVCELSINKINSIVDDHIRVLFQNRLREYNDNIKKALIDPFYDHQGHKIRSVRCYARLASAIPLRYNEKGNATDFVDPDNNHHVAFYEDQEGKLHEHITTFWHAVERKKYGLPVIITNTIEAWEQVTDNIPKEFQLQLPPPAKWQFKLSMQLNEMFVLGMDDESFQCAITNHDYNTLSKHLYYTQTISKNDYRFRHHIETKTDDESDIAKLMGKMKRLSCSSFLAQKPHKVHVSVTGKITEL